MANATARALSDLEFHNGLVAGMEGYVQILETTLAKNGFPADPIYRQVLEIALRKAQEKYREVASQN